MCITVHINMWVKIKRKSVNTSAKCDAMLLSSVVNRRTSHVDRYPQIRVKFGNNAINHAHRIWFRCYTITCWFIVRTFQKVCFSFVADICKSTKRKCKQWLVVVMEFAAPWWDLVFGVCGVCKNLTCVDVGHRENVRGMGQSFVRYGRW